MKSFLFEKYGYYPDNLMDNSFIINGYKFTLSIVDLNEFEIKEIVDITNYIYNLFQNGSAIIKNRLGNYISNDGEQNYILWVCKKGHQNLNDLIKFHHNFNYLRNNKTIDLNEIFTLWEMKMNNIEDNIIPTLRCDDYEYNYILEGVYFALGLAENALQYLKDIIIDLGNKISKCTLVHKRLNSLENNVFFDPLNYIIDSSLRDYAELYKSNQISLENLVRILNYYDYDFLDINVFFARVLYPTKLFDYLELHYIDRMNVKKELMAYRVTLEMEFLRIKNLHNYLVKRFSIRPLNWL